MLYQLQQGDQLNNVSKHFGYEDPKEFFKTMRYEQGSAWVPGAVINCPSKPSSPRDRAYDGQPHTDQGLRGKTFVQGLTMRDVADCINRAFALSTGEANPAAYKQADNGELVNLYGLDLSTMDPGALIQNAMCEVERSMGIFPNVPELKERANEKV